MDMTYPLASIVGGLPSGLPIRSVACARSLIRAVGVFLLALDIDGRILTYQG